jgi:YkoP domain
MSTGSTNFREFKAKSVDHSWLGALVSALDDRLRLHYGVFEYTNCPDCLFRVQLTRNEDDLILSDGVHVGPGARLVNLHVWNEQFPPFPPQGPTLAWASRLNRAFDTSLRELARFLQSRPGLDDVAAICGNMTFEPSCRSVQLAQFVGRFGFEKVAVRRQHSIGQQVHRFGENIFISMIVLARNAGALRADTLWRDRTLVFLSRRKLQDRYGAARERVT